MTIILDGANGITTPSDVTIQSSGGGNFVIQPANSATDRTLTLPDAAGTMMLTDTGVTTAQMPAGSVLQVVQSEQTIARFSTTSTSYVDTGFFVNITPTSSTSKILVSYYAVAYNATHYADITIYRDSTNLDSFGFTFSGYTSWMSNAYSYLDSPATTSQITYKLYVKTGTGTVYVGRNTATGTSNNVRLVAMEIAA